MKLITHFHLVPGSKNEWNYTSTPPIRLHGVVLTKKKHRDKFTFYVLIHVKRHSLIDVNYDFNFTDLVMCEVPAGRQITGSVELCRGASHLCPLSW
jgi:hypothetical protein